ncbi:MAG: Type II secretion system protein G [Candidatus Levybacteria bacterium GW2011_GWA2_40_8]|nr:MAG: Type II secretion system protein G [Candidatus Levybacteria bacterium GW2011_GWA2_40_8]
MKSKGFTFIEMLVVVTIIGVLSAVGVANFKVANQKARDGRRQGDLQQIRASLELYRTDLNVYPITGDLSSLSPTYIQTIPSDPVSGNLYSYESDGKTYTLCSTLELSAAAVTDCGSCGTATCRYKITNPL